MSHSAPADGVAIDYREMYELERAARDENVKGWQERCRQLEHHLRQAMRFMQHTEHFGKIASSGILQAGQDNSTAFNVDEAKALLEGRTAPAARLMAPDSRQLQEGVNAYQSWKSNVNTPTSSAFGGNLHDLAGRIYVAMINAAPQEASAEADSQVDGEAGTVSKAEKATPVSVPHRIGESAPAAAAPFAESAIGIICPESGIRCTGTHCEKDVCQARIVGAPAQETTHSVFEVVIGLLDSHGWDGRANDLRTIVRQIPDVPITRGE